MGDAPQFRLNIVNEELQIENGSYTRIVNKLLDELVHARLLGSELAICLFVIRKTYGYKKTCDQISLTQFEKALNVTRHTVIKALKNLQLVNILTLVKKGNSISSSNEYRLNKYYNTWKLVHTPKLVHSKDTTSKLSYTRTSAHTYTHKRKKEIQKKEIFKKPSLEEVRLYIQELGGGVNAERWLAHYESNGWKVGKNPMKSWKHAIKTWKYSEFNNGTQQEEPRKSIYRGIEDVSEL